MVEIRVLASGSRGNATLVRTSTSALLIDAGISCKQLVARLEAASQDPARLDGVLLTHEHVDHVQGLRVLARRYGLPIFGNAATLEAAASKLDGVPERQVVPTGSTVTVGRIEATSFPVPHDAAEPVGWVLEAEGLRVGQATDLGHVTRLVAHRLAACHALVFEANHDRELLLDGPYPWSTKQRVASRLGHLSNDHAAAALPEIVGAETRAIVLAHLSEQNNQPALARAVVGAALEAAGRPLALSLAAQARPAEAVVL
jgi:phosphoribosyl 1,2-cyclic phosphodiesterase